MTKPLDFLAGLIGQQIDGGCDHCDAFQTVEEHPYSGAWVLTVNHDLDCDFLNNRIPKGLRK
jgi:hypothetical protein